MNDSLRKRLEKLELQQNNITTELESIRDEEQDKYDNLPEGFQTGEQGDALETVIDALDRAIESSNDVENSISDARE